MDFKVAVVAGDGVGPEIVAEGVKVLNAIGGKYGHSFTFEYGLIGGIAIDKEGTALSDDTLEMCKKADAVYLGAVGGPKWDDPRAKVRPEDGLLAIRKGLGLFANVRPVKLHEELIDATNIKPEVVKGTDFIFVRELTGGLYFARPKKQWQTSRGRRAVDTMAYSEKEIERVIRVAFELARGRRKKLTSVDKANVVECSRLWRQVTSEVAADYPDVELENILVDSCAMRLILTPTYFDVMVSENTFGDILTDEASMITGSLGMMPSASLAGVPQEGKKTFGLYEPIHGSAPTLTGLNVANPIATILSAAMMLRHSFTLTKEAEAVEAAVDKVLKEGYRTGDIMSKGKKQVGTKEIGDLVTQKVSA